MSGFPRLVTVFFVGLASTGPCFDHAFADPVVPGFYVEPYAEVPLPDSSTFDDAGNLFCGSGEVAGKIHRVGPGGSPVEDYGDEALPDPDGVLVDDDGTLSGTPGAVLVCGDDGNDMGYVVAVLPDESVVPVSEPSAVMGNPNYMVRGTAGLLLSDSARNKIFQLAPPAEPTVFVDSPAPPQHMAIDGAGNLYVAHGDGVIRVWDAEGTLVDDAYVTGLGSGAGLAIGGGGAFGNDLHVLVPGTGQLLRVADDKTVTVIGTGFGSDLGKITFGPAGALYVAVYEAGRILKVAPCGACGDPATELGVVNASDALAVLRTAVGLRRCPLCVCDTDASGEVVASDALRTLRFAVGLPVTLDCGVD